MSDRFTLRAQDDRRRRLVRSAVAVLVVALIGFGVWAIWFSSLLDARKVEVSGQRTLTADQVEKLAAVPLDGPLARLDATAIEDRVQRDPRVRQAEVSRGWPHTVKVEVTERTAVVWSTVQGQTRGIDVEGVDFRSYPKPPKGIPQATVETTDPEDRLETLQAIGAVAQDLRAKDPELHAVVQSISGRSQDSVVLHLTRNRTVTWGAAEQTSRKLEVLRTLLKKISASGYDVSAPDQPTTSQ